MRELDTHTLMHSTRCRSKEFPDPRALELSKSRARARAPLQLVLHARARAASRLLANNLQLVIRKISPADDHLFCDAARVCKSAFIHSPRALRRDYTECWAISLRFAALCLPSLSVFFFIADFYWAFIAVSITFIGLWSMRAIKCFDYSLISSYFWQIKFALFKWARFE